MQRLARGSELVISNWLVINVTLEQEAAVALAGVLVPTLVIDWRARPVLVSVRCRRIIAALCLAILFMHQFGWDG